MKTWIFWLKWQRVEKYLELGYRTQTTSKWLISFGLGCRFEFHKSEPNRKRPTANGLTDSIERLGVRTFGEGERNESEEAAERERETEGGEKSYAEANLTEWRQILREEAKANEYDDCYGAFGRRDCDARWLERRRRRRRQQTADGC